VRTLASLLHDPLEPAAVDAAYAMAGAGAYAVPLLIEALRNDREEDTDLDRGSHDGSRADSGIPARSAAFGLAEIGLPAVPGLLGVLCDGAGSRARKLAAFALGEIAGTSPEVVEALCRAIRDPAPGVRINATEALGLKPATPASVAALSAALKDADTHTRFSAALSLAQIGPAAEAAVPVLEEALDDPNRYVPGYAVEALERIGTPRAIKVLVPYLKNARWCAHTSPASIY
jgi:HEAT repeat protein